MGIPPQVEKFPQGANGAQVPPQDDKVLVLAKGYDVP